MSLRPAVLGGPCSGGGTCQSGGIRFRDSATSPHGHGTPRDHVLAL